MFANHTARHPCHGQSNPKGLTLHAGQKVDGLRAEKSPVGSVVCPVSYPLLCAITPGCHDLIPCEYPCRPETEQKVPDTYDDDLCHLSNLIALPLLSRIARGTSPLRDSGRKLQAPIHWVRLDPTIAAAYLLRKTWQPLTSVLASDHQRSCCLNSLQCPCVAEFLNDAQHLPFQ